MNETGYEKAKAMAEKLKAETEAKEVAEQEQKEVALVALDSLKSMSRLGMSHIDMADVRPSQILIVQKSSDLEALTDIEGKTPELGKFFDTGKRISFSEFDCYVLFAKKSTWIDKRKPEKGEQPMYTMIGVNKTDLTPQGIFGMMLRSSARYSLNNLFSVAVTQGYPMFAFNVHVEIKELQNDQGKWWIPVFRPGQLETDNKVLGTLMMLAKRFDSNAEGVELDEDQVLNAMEGEKPSNLTGSNEDVPF